MKNYNIVPVWLALATGLALLTGVLNTALADAAGPVVYGRVNVSLEKVDDEGAQRLVSGSAPAITDQWELNSNSSRLGVKGEFDLDAEGLKAIYQAEYEINVDDGGNGDTAFRQRNIFGGLKGGFGQVIFGKFDTPLKKAEGKVDQFNDLTGSADIDVLIGGQNRVSNIIQYSTPKLGIVRINAAFIPAEGSDADLDGQGDNGLADTVSASLVAENKGWYGALAYETDQTARRSVDGIVRGDIIRAVGAYKQDTFEAGVLLQQVSDVVSGSNLEDTSVLLSGAVIAGRFKYKAQYGISEGNVSDENGTLTAFGVDYAFAKKSALYIYASSLSLDNADLSDDAFGVGVVHSF